MNLDKRLLWLIPILIIGYFTYVGIKISFVHAKQEITKSILEEQGYQLEINETTIVSQLKEVEDSIAAKEAKLSNIDYQTIKQLPSNAEHTKQIYTPIVKHRLGINTIEPISSDSLITKWLKATPN
jgi:hypothetical protein